MSTEKQDVRRPLLLRGLDIAKPGLEISPLFRPTALKTTHNVFYTDYTSADDSRAKHSNYAHDEIMDIDFVWTPGLKLADCVPPGSKFDWAIASHVLEHVPDPIGWLLETFDVMTVGAVFVLALPDKRYCYDKFRTETEASDLIDNWVRRQKIPSPRQVFDFLSRSVNDLGNHPNDEFNTTEKFEDAPRTYTDAEALNFAINSWQTGSYFDVHCSVFTPDGFHALIEKLNSLGILNVVVSKPEIVKEEFYVRLTKIGEPRIAHPGPPSAGAIGHDVASDGASQADLDHARKAFQDAVVIQNELKDVISNLESRPSFKSWVPDWLRRMILN